MKTFKTHLVLLFLILFSVFSASAVYAEGEENISPASITEEKHELSVVMAINQEDAVADGIQYKTTSPILVFNKTYVNLYDMAPILNYRIDWIEAEIGYFKVTAADDKTYDFTLISKYDDLTSQNQKYFVKDDTIFVSLRELTDISGYPLKYSGGIIYIGKEDIPRGQMYGDINTYTWNDYIYAKYPRPASYIVNPYQQYSHDTMMDDAIKLQRMYPDLIKLSSIGASVENRDLLLLEFGRGSRKIFVCGTHHAREYIATTYLMYAIDRYAYAYRTNSMWGNYNPREILDNITFCIVPMVNPDGVNLVQNGIYSTDHADELANMKIYQGSKYGYSAWKANVHGVDVNWNYDKDWSESRNKNARGSTGFNGDYPNSEPETAAVAAYVDTYPFEAFLSFHTQGQIFYWADSKTHPLYIHEAIRNDTGFSGERDSGTGVGGSFFDYVYRRFDRPTITVELCPYIGPYPYPNDDFDTVWNPAKNILLIVGNKIMYDN